MREIKTTVGHLIERGKSLRENEHRVYSFLEVRTDAGEIARINNAVVGNECDRGLAPGGRVAILHAYTEKATSNAFPNSTGLSVVYAVANNQLGRQFDDIEQLVRNGDKLRLIVSISRWAAVLVTLYSAAYFGVTKGSSGFWIGLVGAAIIFGAIYLMNISHLASAAPLYATRDEVEPASASLTAHLETRGA